MLAAPGDDVFVRSTRVVLDGRATSAVLGLHGSTRGPVVSSINPVGVEGDIVDLGSSIIAPAPLDIHFHGAGGHVVPPAGDVAAIDEALAASSRRTTWRDERIAPPAYDWVATLPVPSADSSDVVSEVAAAARAITASNTDGSTGCVGIRLEGCFLNPDRAGVWPPEGFHRPTIELLEQLHAAADRDGAPLLIVDLAPELLEGEELGRFVRRACELDVIVSLAHTDATWEQACQAIDAGARLATHTWNAMRPVAHRDPGVVAAALADPRVTCELICDGVHLHPGTIALSVAASGTGNWIAVSDASPFAGCTPGAYDWAGTTVHHDGVALRDVDGRLAGSASLLWHARDVLQTAGVDRLHAVLAAGAAPRRVLAAGRSLGLEVGDPAWIVVDD